MSTDLQRWESRKNKTADWAATKYQKQVAKAFSVKALEQIGRIGDVRVRDVMQGKSNGVKLVVNHNVITSISTCPAGISLANYEHTARDLRRPRGAQVKK